MKLVPLILSLVIALAFAQRSSGQTQSKETDDSVLVIGTGRIVKENLAEARKVAISEALVRGVEAFLTERLGSEGMVNNFPTLINDLIPRAGEQIENFHILAEEQTGGQFKILVRLKINKKVMEEKLREIGVVSMEGPPLKVLFLVSQIEKQEERVSYWWKDPRSDSDLTLTELSLHRIFQERGFNPINRVLNVPDEDYSQELRALDLNHEYALQWGKVFSADVVILGKSEIIEDQGVSIDLGAFDTESGNMVYQGNHFENSEEVLVSTENVMLTLDRAVNKIAAKMSPAIIGSMEAPEMALGRLDITVRGLRSFKQLRALKDFLQGNVAGVQSVIQTRVKGRTISLAVEFAGSEDTFLELVSNHEEKPFSLDIAKGDGGGVVFSLQ